MNGNIGLSDRCIPVAGTDIPSYEALMILKLKKLLNNIYSCCDSKNSKTTTDSFSFRVFICIEKNVMIRITSEFIHSA